MMSDPRVFFAAERTLLAWVRTGLTIMGFGFVVARFGLFLHLLAAQSGAAAMPKTAPFEFSNLAGVALILCGVGCMVLGAIQHRSYVATLPPADVPRTHDAKYPIALSLFLAVLGLALAAYLMV